MLKSQRFVTRKLTRSKVMKYSKGSKADHAGGCYGDNMPMKAHSPVVSVGKQVHNDFMSGKAAAPKLDHSKDTSFRPGGEVTSGGRSGGY